MAGGGGGEDVLRRYTCLYRPEEPAVPAYRRPARLAGSVYSDSNTVYPQKRTKRNLKIALSSISRLGVLILKGHHRLV